MKKLVSTIISLIVILVGGAVTYINQQPSLPSSTVDTSIEDKQVNNPQLLTAFNNRVTKLQVKGQGVIVKVLRDDRDGVRHQRLLLKVNPNQTVLIAHNIDLAEPVINPKEGEVIAFYGEFVWNNKGGVIHWTHKDPRGRHINGWLFYQGRHYQ